MDGINIHADEARVNVNFWLSPDDASLDRDSGGLVVHKAPAPEDWDFSMFNNHKVSAIRELVTNSKAGSVKVPFRRNRMVMFDSSLFHETDKFKFKPSYKSRRINVTMLFGKRIETHNKSSPKATTMSSMDH